MIVKTLAMIGDTLPRVCREQEAIRFVAWDRSAMSAAVQRSEDVCVEGSHSERRSPCRGSEVVEPSSPIDMKVSLVVDSRKRFSALSAFYVCVLPNKAPEPTSTLDPSNGIYSERCCARGSSMTLGKENHIC